MPRTHVREWLAFWSQDARYAARWFRRAPGFALATVGTLALGIGATTAIFSVVRGVLLRPLPYPASDHIVQLWELGRSGNHMQFSDPNFDDVRNRIRDFTGVAEFALDPTVSVAGDIAPMRASMTEVTHDFFDVLGVRPVLGRTFLPEEERENGVPAVIVSWGVWHRVWNGRPDALGKRLTMGDQTYTVVGVMPPELDFPPASDLWISRELFGRLPARTAHNFEVVARLRPGATLDETQRSLSALARALATQYGSETITTDMAIVPLREQLVGNVRPTLLILLAASIVLLVIACANVANLLVARLTARRGELAVRLALGAARVRLVQQCLAESLMLTCAGGALGVVIASVATRAVVALDPGHLPRAHAVRLDAVVLLFAAGVSVGTALVLALVSTWRTTRPDLREVLSASERIMSGAGSPARARQSLVVAQVAMTIVLVIGTGLLGRSLLKLLAVDPGFRTTNAVVLDVTIGADDSLAQVRRTVFYHELLRRLATIPGVTAVGAVNVIPLAPVGISAGNFIELASPEDRIRPEDVMRVFQDHTRSGYAEFRAASGGYFQAMHIPLLEGRTFDDRDVPDAATDVAVVSASLARGQWPGRSPIGRWIQFGNMDGDTRPFQIIGVVGDVHERGLDAPPQPAFYADYLQRPVPTSRMNIVLAGPVDPRAVTMTAATILRDLRPDVPPRFRTIESIVNSSVASRRLVLVLVGVFAAAAVVLAVLGLYSVISYLVAQRTHELRVRIALGAREADIVRLVVGEGGVLAATGIAIGTLVAFVGTRLLGSLLYGISATDVLAFGTSALGVALAALAACWLPAHRAARAASTGVARHQ